MTDQPSTRPWFRPRRFGYGATPITWEGWLSVLVFVVVVMATVSFDAPWGQGPDALRAWVKTHHHVGVRDLWPGHAVIIVAVVAEITGFVAFTRWKTSGPWLQRGGREL